MNDTNFYKEANEGFRWGLYVIALTILGLILTGTMWVFGFGLFQRETANFRGETAQRERTLADPDYRMANYDHFYDLCYLVRALDTKIATMEESDLPKDQKSTNLLALRNQRTQLVNEYNADSRKTETKAQLKASDLPESLDEDGETTCE